MADNCFLGYLQPRSGVVNNYHLNTPSYEASTNDRPPLYSTMYLTEISLIKEMKTNK